jgi:hypothetical protein
MVLDIPDELVGWVIAMIVGGLVLLIRAWAVHREHKQQAHELSVPRKWK